jgi:lipoate-protein ligase A
MECRLLHHGARDAFTNMAVDEFLLREGIPTLRFYTWRPSAVSIGYFQSVAEEVNLAECARRGVDVVRRISGGGAVYHDEHGELTYSFTCPQHLLKGSVLDSYRVIGQALACGLSRLDIDAACAGINDIVVDGRKVSGSAQTRRHGGILQHGTILRRVDVQTMFSLLRVSSAKITDKVIRQVEDRVTSIEQEYGPVADAALVEALMRGFEEVLQVTFAPAELDAETRQSVASLRERYASDEWNRKR